MPISVREEPAHHFQILVDGRFTCDAYHQFLDAVEWAIESSKSVTFDLYHTEYMEGSALGLFLIARSGLPHKNAILKVNQDSEIEEMLEAANFDKLFAIQRA